MTTMVCYEGRIVAFVGRNDVHLAPAIDALPDGDEVLRIVLLMCDYALLAAQADPRIPYRDDDALAFARARLRELAD